jgi:RimJ/RimL family protein N-acetyltransferase
MAASNEALDPAQLSFRPLTEADVPRLWAWFDAPHARRWFARERTAASIVEEFMGYLAGSEPIHNYIVMYAGRDIGLVQWTRLGNFSLQMNGYEVTDPDVVNVDILIGDAGHVRRGLGAPLVRRFLDEIVFAADPRFQTCLIDPERENSAAIRAYEKAGFTFVRTVIDPEDGKTALHLMELRRQTSPGS